MSQKPDVKQNQQLVFSLAMRQALEVLQMPLHELSQWMKQQAEHNPALELKEKIEDRHERTRSFAVYHENIIKPPSLFEFLMQQAKTCFRNEELTIAEHIIGNLDERGFFSNRLILPYPMEKTAEILKTVRSFDPPGIAASNLQESLLIQLLRKGKRDTLGFKIVNNFFEDLLHHRISNIAKKIKCTPKLIKNTIQKDLSSLNLQPASGFDQHHCCPVVPDIVIENHDGKWSIEINRRELPSLELSLNFLKYINAPHLSHEEKASMRRNLASGKWLLRIVSRRHQILTQIARLLLTKHASFFSGESDKFNPSHLEEIADLLEMHKSTLARAIYEKNLFCSQGLFPLKRFITTSTMQNIKHTAKELLLLMIQTENKFHPLTDQQLSENLKNQNIPCSRRTIAKYRQILNIPSANHRKLF